MARQEAVATYDVFLSYNDTDRDEVEAIAARLSETGLRPFLDQWDLVPGETIIPAVERAVEASRAVAVFVGTAG